MNPSEFVLLQVCLVLCLLLLFISTYMQVYCDRSHDINLYDSIIVLVLFVVISFSILVTYSFYNVCAYCIQCI